MKRGFYLLTLFMIALIYITASGCGPILYAGEMENLTRTINLENIENAIVNIDMGMGELKISGGSEQLLDADFNYNIDKWKPDIEYNVEEKQGHLKIKQPDVHSWNIRGKVKNEWDLRFNDQIPVRMNIDAGVGESNLELSSLNLQTLKLDTGVGEVKVNLKDSPITELKIDAGVGEVRIDLTGDIKNDVNVEIDSGVGEMTLLLTDRIGVEVNVEKGIGSIDAKGFKRDGKSYVNDAYGESDTNMHVNVDAGVGEVNLILVESEEIDV